MRKLLILCFLLCGKNVFANQPLAGCPTGMLLVYEPDAPILDYCYDLGIEVEACTSSSSDECYMYIPAGVSFTDDKGIYEYTGLCAME